VLLDGLRVAACAAVLVYACACDWRTRRVRNRVWYPLVAVGAALAMVDWATGDQRLPGDLALSVGFTSAFAYLLYRLGLFGGADAKALMAISLAVPQYPLFLFDGYTLPILHLRLGFLPIFAFTALVNAVLLTAVLPLALLVRNATRLGSRRLRGKWGLALLGYPIPLERLPRPHLRLLHSYEERAGEVALRFARRGEEVSAKVARRLAGWHRRGLILEEVWVTPQLPFIIPITIGFVTALVVGDLMLNLMAGLWW